ncbi:acyltransferase domain-containing protein [Kitasatospora sp. NPDC086009]|uniref:acyltransferase domain-containing protein n=1 Tax=unclassified Kitasatospora TaxID=2633591 RepID=UPI0037C850A7
MEPVTLPDAEQLPEALLELAVPFEEVNAVLAARTRLARDGGLRAAFDEALREQVAAVGTLGRPSGLHGSRPAGFEADGHLLTLLFVALAPHARAYHRALGIGPAVTRNTLADLGRQLVVSRWRGHPGGLGNPSWLTLHFRGELYQLGRLQFQRKRLTGADAESAAAAGFGPWSLQLHIPDHSGPLSAEACDRALARARDFFARHFPTEPYATAFISSWLLDPQLRRHLPEDSNIVRFQKRFTPLRPPGEPADDNPLRYVFGDSGRPLESLPRDTPLQRALVDHLRAGGHWYVVGGWLRLGEDDVLGEDDA